MNYCEQLNSVELVPIDVTLLTYDNEANRVDVFQVL